MKKSKFVELMSEHIRLIRNCETNDFYTDEYLALVLLEKLEEIGMRPPYWSEKKLTKPRGYCGPNGPRKRYTSFHDTWEPE